jgi:serine protease SohB
VIQFIADYGLFLAKVLTVVVGILLVIGGALALAVRSRRSEDGHLAVRKLNERFDAMRDALREATLDPKALKRLQREESKARKKDQRNAATGRSRVFVLDFDGDVRAQAVAALREEVSAILTQAAAGDRVLLRLESPGGTVHGYGLAAAQLERLRDRGLELVVAVDKVAASGGYMMACVGSQLIAAPFAILGSIGVVAQVPNFHRLLRRHDIDYELLTAGRYKRTLTVFGRNTEEGRRKFAEELEETHALFRDYVARWRPSMNMDVLATGETWHGAQALPLGLIDAIGTSDQWLQDAAATADLLSLRYVERKTIAKRLGVAVEEAVFRGVGRALERLDGPGERMR